MVWIVGRDVGSEGGGGERKAPRKDHPIWRRADGNHRWKFDEARMGRVII